MTEQELKQEWDYRYKERIGIMCDGAIPTPYQIHIAKCEADEAVARLKNDRSSGMAE